MDGLILGPKLTEQITRHRLRTDPLDALAKEMEAFRKEHPKAWRTNHIWLRMCREFGPLYRADYERRKAER